MSRRWPFIQSSSADVIGANKAHERFTSLEAELATIGAKIRAPVLMVHDEVRFDVEVPSGLEAQAAAITDKYFPNPNPGLRERVNQLTAAERGSNSTRTRTVSLRSELIRLGASLAEDQNRAHDLWTWLPSYTVAQRHHGDYASEFQPEIADIMTEAALYIAKLRRGVTCATKNEEAEEKDWFESCSCGDDHDAPPEDKPVELVAPIEPEPRRHDDLGAHYDCPGCSTCVPDDDL